MPSLANSKVEMKSIIQDFDQIDQRHHIHPSATKLYWKLVAKADINGNVEDSFRSLVQQTKLSINTIREASATLVRLNLIHITLVKGKNHFKILYYLQTTVSKTDTLQNLTTPSVSKTDTPTLDTEVTVSIFDTPNSSTVSKTDTLQNFLTPTVSKTDTPALDTEATVSIFDTPNPSTVSKTDTVQNFPTPTVSKTDTPTLDIEATVSIFDTSNPSTVSKIDTPTPKNTKTVSKTDTLQAVNNNNYCTVLFF